VCVQDNKGHHVIHSPHTDEAQQNAAAAAAAAAATANSSSNSNNGSDVGSQLAAVV